MMAMSRFSGLLGAVAFAALTACSNTADGVKEDAQNAAQATDSAAGRVGDAMAGTADAAHAAKQTADIKTALAADTRIGALEINVDSDGATKTVRLRGTVDTEAQKTLAEQIAAGKAEGYRIVNELTVRPKP